MPPRISPALVRLTLPPVTSKSNGHVSALRPLERM
jgi:hypothetical protein